MESESTTVKLVIVWRLEGRSVTHHFSLCIPEVHEALSSATSYSALLFPSSLTLEKRPTNDTLLNH